jgi:hypothetical protein
MGAKTGEPRLRSRGPTTMGSRLGVLKSAATKTGCTFEEWTAHREAGEIWTVGPGTNSPPQSRRVPMPDLLP